MNEIWKEIKEYPNYFVSNFGRVKSFLPRNQFALKKKEKILKGRLNKSGPGYLTVSPRKKGRNHNKLIHRLVAEAFIPNPDNKPQVNHKNGISIDNSVYNLEWNSALENIRHAWRIGLSDSNYVHARGENHGQSKLNEKQVRIIKHALSFGATKIGLSRMFRVSRMVIQSIAKGKIWNYVKI